MIHYVLYDENGVIHRHGMTQKVSLIWNPEKYQILLEQYKPNHKVDVEKRVLIPESTG